MANTIDTCINSLYTNGKTQKSTYLQYSLLLYNKRLCHKESTMAKRLYRSKSDRKIFGVCGGLADYFDIDPTIIRVIFLASIFFTGGGIIAYLILAIITPEENV